MSEILSSLALQLVLGLVACVLALPFVFARRRAAAADRERLRRAGRHATGLVLEAWQDSNGWNITYEFTPQGHSASVRKTESIEGVKCAPAAVGASIQVAYEDSSPFYSVPVFPATLALQGQSDAQVRRGSDA